MRATIDLNNGSGRARLIPVGLLGLLLAALLPVLLPSAAQAQNRFSVDSKADTPGAIVIDSSGTGYVAWDRPAAGGAPDTVHFCKIPRGGTCTAPITLPLPAGDAYGISQPFPAFGAVPGVVYVVGPSYDLSDTIIWTSTNSGASFGAPYDVPVGSYRGGTGVGDVLRDPGSPTVAQDGGSITEDYFDVASSNPGLYYSNVGNAIVGEAGTGGGYTFGSGGQGGTLAYEPSGSDLPVVAYWNDTTPATIDYYYENGGLVGESSSWPGPTQVTDGTLPRLASGPSGLFLLSQDYTSSTEANPTRIDIRKYDPTTHTFGSPTLLADDSASDSAATEGDPGDLYENPSNGDLYAVWPGVRSADGAFVMRLWTSTNGGQSWSAEQDVALIGFGYSGIPRVAAAADGQGFVTFEDSGGLEVADLKALPDDQLLDKIPHDASPQLPSGSAIAAASAFSGNLLELAQPVVAPLPTKTFSAIVQTAKLLGKSTPGISLKSVEYFFDGGVRRSVLVGPKGHRHRRTLLEPDYTGKLLPGIFRFVPSRLGGHAGANVLTVRIALARAGSSHTVTVTLRSTITLP